MRAAKLRYSDSEANKASNTNKKNVTKNNNKKSFKFITIIAAVVITVAGLVIPTTTLAPAVGAFSDRKAVENLEQEPTAINVNCDVEQTVPTTVEPTTQPQTTVAATQPTTEEETSAAETAESEAVDESYYEIEVSEDELSSQEYVDDNGSDNGNDSSGSYLMSIKNPDKSYSPKAVNLSSYDRAKLERLVMGEAGANGFNGCALVAQAIRDAMNRSHTSSIDAIISEYQYYAPTNRQPNQNVKDAVAYIFDENGSAVQHRVLCFYSGKSSWHETQNFVVECNGERFFDMWD